MLPEVVGTTERSGTETGDDSEETKCKYKYFIQASVDGVAMSHYSWNKSQLGL